MTWSFLILATVTAAGAVAAMTLRNLVHCALSLVATFAGLAGLFLQLQAEFVGLVQILIYVGAVAILIVFALLLTRQLDPSSPPAPVATAAGWGIGIAGATFLVIGGAIRSSMVSWRLAPPKDEVTVRALGDRLMQDYVLPLEVMGLLLTAALIGAVILALPEGRSPSAPRSGAAPPAPPNPLP